MKSPCHNLFVLVEVLFLCWQANLAQANVYPTDIRLNGSFQYAVLLPGGSVTISYVLNDVATGGVWIQIYNGTNLVETLASTNGNAGTNAGLNSVSWDGSSDQTNATNLAEGAYSVSITAASAGYETWTNITDDGSNFSVLAPRGITVNQNTNSPYYGRVYVADAHNQTEGGPSGIFKYNADGSPADEGSFSDGGYNWGTTGYSPWKMVVGADDRLYVDDFSGQGAVVSFDPTIDDTSLRQVISTTNYPDPMLYPDLELSGFALVASGTNVQIWMTDQNPYGSLGVIGWHLGPDGTASTNDTGTPIIPLDSEFLTQAPYDLTVDSNGFIYTVEYLTNGGPPAYALISFHPYLEVPDSWGFWADEWYPALLRASGVAVDPAAALVAMAVIGHCDTEHPCGGLYLFDASDGKPLTNLDQMTGGPYYDVAWDNVRNLYTVGGPLSNSVWRVYSPPGTNQATTVAVPFIQVYNSLQPAMLCNPWACPDHMHFLLQGQSNITYLIQSSSDLTNWVAVATNYSILTNRWLSVPVGGSQSFYRAVTLP